MRKIQLQAFLIYYKRICPFTMMVSIGLLYTYHQFKEGALLFNFSKSITLILTAVMLKFLYKTYEFTFYENLGIRQNVLILTALLFDWLVFAASLKLIAFL